MESSEFKRQGLPSDLADRADFSYPLYLLHPPNPKVNFIPSRIVLCFDGGN
jgi:hypothetical protein